MEPGLSVQTALPSSGLLAHGFCLLLCSTLALLLTAIFLCQRTGWFKLSLALAMAQHHRSTPVLGATLLLFQQC